MNLKCSIWQFLKELFWKISNFWVYLKEKLVFSISFWFNTKIWICQHISMLLCKFINFFTLIQRIIVITYSTFNILEFTIEDINTIRKKSKFSGKNLYLLNTAGRSRQKEKSFIQHYIFYFVVIFSLSITKS